MERIQLRRSKGWRLPESAVNCARPGPLGNPFAGESPQESVDAFEAWLSRGVVAKDLLHKSWLPYDPQSLEARRQSILAQIEADEWSNAEFMACWCPLSQPCHVDSIIRRIAIRRLICRFNSRARGEEGL